MTLANLIWGSVPALLVYGLTGDGWISGLVWWIGFRLEFLSDAITAHVTVSSKRAHIEALVARSNGVSL